jgi:hypothetical protein
VDRMELLNSIEQITQCVIDVGRIQGLNESLIRSDVARAVEAAYTRTMADRSGIPTLAAIATNLYVQAFNQCELNRDDMHLQETCLAAAQRVLDRIFTGTSNDYSRMGKTWREQLQEKIDALRARDCLTEPMGIRVEGAIECLDLPSQAKFQGYRGCVNAHEFCGVPARKLRLDRIEYLESSAREGRLKLMFVLLLSPTNRSQEADFDELP